MRDASEEAHSRDLRAEKGADLPTCQTPGKALQFSSMTSTIKRFRILSRGYFAETLREVKAKAPEPTTRVDTDGTKRVKDMMS